MKICGRYSKERTYYSIAADIEDNSYVVMDVDTAYIKTSDGSSVGDCKTCYIQVHSGSFSFEIRFNDHKYLSPQKAEDVIKKLAEKNFVNLDEYQMRLYEALDVSKKPITVTNECDEDTYEAIPLVIDVASDE